MRPIIGVRPAAWISLLIAALVIAGCAESVHTLPADYKSHEGSVIAGRIEIIRTSTGAPFWKAPAFFPSQSDYFDLVIERDGSGHKQTFRTATPGAVSDFYAVLPAGRYRLHEISTAFLAFPLNAVFEVPRGDAVYIGTLRFSLDDARYGGGLLMLMARGRWSIEDTSEPVVRRLQQRYPHVTAPVATSFAFFQVQPRAATR